MAKLRAEDVNRHLGARIRMRRKALSLTLKDLAHAVDMSHQQILKYEQGGSRISAPVLCQLCEALDVPVEWFFEGLPSTQTSAPNSAVPPFLLTPQGARLVEAFDALPDNTSRRRLLDFLEALGRR